MHLSVCHICCKLLSCATDFRSCAIKREGGRRRRSGGYIHVDKYERSHREIDETSPRTDLIHDIVTATV